MYFENPKQKELYFFLLDYISANNFAPQLKEIMSHLKLTKKTVRKHRDKLEKMGLIEVVAGKQRGIKLK
tara:strand:- start:3003 stop:3209 length:207 start_codon:yes stop_codon:yes gene_type:complete